jgi:chorismate-pyruvate lyase
MNTSNQILDAIPAKKERTFDPLRELFVAQAARPNDLSEVNLRALTPYQRALLMIDGTVTKFIEAYTLEPVEIIRLSQTAQLLPEDHRWLEAPQGTSVIAREVLLRSRYGQAPLAYAASLVVPERLPRAVRESLEVHGQGLGKILLNREVETRRELLWYGMEQPKRLPEDFHQLAGREFISRTYRIISGGQPIMLINEKFAPAGDRLPSHH